MTKLLMVLTSHDELGDSGEKTGFWLEEFAAPYFVFKDAGVEVVLASPKGGQPPVDPKSEASDAQTDATNRFNGDAAAQDALASTQILSKICDDQFDAVFFPGGHGPMWDLAQDADSIKLIEAFGHSNRPIGFVCHAPAVLKHPKNSSGEPMVSGKAVTGFSNAEEEGVGLVDVVPFLVEDMLIEVGGKYEKGDPWASYVVVDGNLVTGQNPASSEDAARKLMTLMRP